MEQLNLKQCFSKAIDIYCGHFFHFIGIAALPMIFLILSGLFTGFIETVPLVIIPSVILALMGMVLYFYSLVAVMMSADAFYQDQNISLVQAYQQSTSCAMKFWGASLVYQLMMMVGFVLLIIPGFWISIVFCMAPYAVVLDRINIVDSFSHSKRLLDGYFWKICLLGVSLLGAGMVFALPLSFLGGEVLNVVVPVVQLVLGLIVPPLVITLGVGIYRSLRDMT